MKETTALGVDLKKRFQNPKNITQINSALDSLSAYYTEFNKFFGKIAEQKKSDQAMVDAARTAREVCDTARADQKTKMEAQIRRAHSFIYSFCGIALLIGAVIAAWIALTIKKSMAYAVGISTRVAGGDLTQEIEVSSKDEIGELLSAMKRMVDNLRKMFTDITKGIETLASSSTELSAISQQMSSNSEQSAGKVGQCGHCCRRDDRQHEFGVSCCGAGFAECRDRGLGRGRNEFDHPGNRPEYGKRTCNLFKRRHPDPPAPPRRWNSSGRRPRRSGKSPRP